MPDPALRQALKEAFASAPADTVILDTPDQFHVELVIRSATEWQRPKA